MANELSLFEPSLLTLLGPDGHISGELARQKKRMGEIARAGEATMDGMRALTEYSVAKATRTVASAEEMIQAAGRQRLSPVEQAELRALLQQYLREVGYATNQGYAEMVLSFERYVAAAGRGSLGGSLAGLLGG
jgi:hypothetical protein